MILPQHPHNTEKGESGCPLGRINSKSMHKSHYNTALNYIPIHTHVLRWHHSAQEQEDMEIGKDCGTTLKHLQRGYKLNSGSGYFIHHWYIPKTIHPQPLAILQFTAKLLSC